MLTARLAKGFGPFAVFLAAGLLVAYKLLPVLELVAVAVLVAVVLGCRGGVRARGAASLTESLRFLNRGFTKAGRE